MSHYCTPIHVGCNNYYGNGRLYTEGTNTVCLLQPKRLYWRRFWHFSTQCLLAVVRKELDDIRIRDKIIEKTHNGYWQKSIWKMSVQEVFPELFIVKTRVFCR